MKTTFDQDLFFIRRAHELALKAKGRTSPNPLVGAVVVKEGQIVGEGYHAFAGADHAEVIALKQAGSRARGATLYLNLEPCCHHGRTPPCTDRIIEAGIERVVASTIDPNPLVAGKGIEQLKRAGIQVEVGLLKEEAERLNEAFLTFMRTGRPFVILKIASSLDGKIATRTGESRWITGEEARLKVHELRNEVDAVLVGIGTVLKDDPSLTVRLHRGGTRDPLRVVVDAYGRTPLEAKVLKGPGRPLIAVSKEAPSERVEALEAHGAEILRIDAMQGRISLTTLLQELGRRGIMSVMIEGGSTLNASALEEGVVDKILLFVAPIIIGGREVPGMIGGAGIERLNEAIGLERIRVEGIGNDLLIEAYLQRRERGSPKVEVS